MCPLSGYSSLWDISSGWIIHTFNIVLPFTGDWGGISSVAISPDGSSALTGVYHRGRVRSTTLWDMNTGSAIRSFYGGEYSRGPIEAPTYVGRVGSVAYSPDGAKVLLGCLDNKARLYRLNGDSIMVLSAHTQEVASVAFSPDGSKILTGSSDSTAKLWDVATGNVIKTFLGHKDKVTAVAYAPNGSTFLTGSLDSTARLWNAGIGDLIRTFSGYSNGVTSVAYSPDGSKVLTGALDCTVKLWDISNISVTSLKGTQKTSEENTKFIIKCVGKNTLIIKGSILKRPMKSSCIVYTLSGRIIWRNEVQNTAAKNWVEYRLPQNLGTGIYLYRFVNGDEAVNGTFACF